MEKRKEGKKEKNEDHQRGGGLTGVVVVVVVVKGEAASVRTAQGGRNQCQQAICGQLTREGEEGGGERWSANCWNPQRNRGNSRQKNSAE